MANVAVSPTRNKQESVCGKILHTSLQAHLWTPRLRLTAVPFAIVDIAGFQEKVAPGMKLRVPRLPAKVGQNVAFERVLLTATDSTVQVGNPYVAGAKIEAKILAEGRGEKIHVFKMKRRKRYRRTRGHRQDYTEIEILKV